MNELLSCIYEGNTLFFPAAHDIGLHIAKGHAWDANVRTILQEVILQKTPVIVEVGTNIGATLLQIKLAKPDATVHCFEPSSQFFDSLQKNIAANNWKSVHPNQIGLSDAPGNIQLHNVHSTASIVSPAYDGHHHLFDQQIEVTTLDAYTKDLDRLDFIKSDTDGYEHQVLKGAERTLVRSRPLLYFEFQISQLEAAGENPKDLLDYLVALGYDGFLLFNNFGLPLKFATKSAEILELYKTVRFMDILAVHKSQQHQRQRVEMLAENFASGKVTPVIRPPIIR